MENNAEHEHSDTESSAISSSFHDLNVSLCSTSSSNMETQRSTGSITDCEAVSEGSSFRSFSPSKPHKGNDIRWDAIQRVKGKDGELGLGHFRLLKKLGFGDIGSVYLAELRGMGCLFAMKVMDKGMLAGRKKLVRAETERDILSLLDHPFLPSLYSHFETHKFSCLLMEFCSGGDLHTLRQRQQGKHFTEQAARLVNTCIMLVIMFTLFLDECGILCFASLD